MRAETYAAAADNSLVKRAKELDVEILFFLDDADLRLAASSFQDCKFEQLEDRVLAKIVEWDRDEPAAKKQKPDGEKTYGLWPRIVYTNYELVFRLSRMSRTSG